VKERIKSLQKLMKKHKIQAYLVPSTDPHQSEYVPAVWERRKWLSGFTGSAGDLAITTKTASLWTDSRYFLQAEEQLRGSGIQLFKSGLPETPPMHEWLKSQLKAGDRVGIDSKVISHKEAKTFEDFLKPWKISLIPIEENLIDKIWEDQPEFPASPIMVHPLPYAGITIKEKIENLQKQMKAEKVDVHILTTLDTIAWLFNIRGRDVDFNPVVISYAVVTSKKALLFTPLRKVSKEVRKHFGRLVECYDYKNFPRQLQKISKAKVRVWVDPNTINWWIVNSLAAKCELLFKESPVVKMKAIKNRKEIEGLRACHIRDGVAMAKFLYWLDKSIDKEVVTEISAAEKLEGFRSEQEHYQGPSFHTISAFWEHGAIVHYTATSETDIKLNKPGIYLIDSGGHYLDGTTDITRTIALGEPTAEQKDRFTRVLKGHIQLASTRFPKGTAGNQLDTLARKSLWDVGLNYGHGTGHGIGSYLNVHEGPQAISYYRGIGVALEENMVVSNEPGYYKAGEYGMRIENLILIIKDQEFSDKATEFLTFETVTLCPVDLNLIHKSLLDDTEIKWLNEYHEKVRNTLSPHLGQEEQEWLNEATAAI
jgi:Xaa-Pro aminopeptidase